MRKLLLIFPLLISVAYAQITQVARRATIVQLKAYNGTATVVYVSDSTNFYITCSPCTADEVYIFAGAGTKKWKRLLNTQLSILSAKQNAITLGTTAQYFRGDLSLATFPTNNTAFTNGAGYLVASDITGKANLSLPQFTDQIGIGIAPSAAARITLPNGTTAADGIKLGDITIYRKAAQALQTNCEIWNQYSIYAPAVYNYLNTTYSSIQLQDIGVLLSRNVGDGNPAVILKQAHASSTGDIAQFTNSAGTKSVINQLGWMAIGATAVAASAALDVTSTTRGFLPPRMTTAQRNAITAVAGLTVYCTDCTATDASTGVMQTYNGSTWKNYW